MTAAPHAGDRAELLELLAEQYPGDVALGLLALCSPRCEIHNGRACQHPGKRPLAAGWTAEAAARWADPDADADRGRARMADHAARGGNVGWCPPAGVLVLDADTPEAVAYLERALPDAPAQDTAHGAHYVVRLPAGVTLPARCGVALAPGVAVDLRPGGAAQIVVAPSIHESGHVYSWRRSLPADLGELPEIPAGLLAALVGTDRATTGERDAASADEIPAGARNATLASLAGTMRRRGMGADEIEAALGAVNARRCRPPLADAEVASIARSVGRYRPAAESDASDKTVASPALGHDGEPLTDTGNAERLVRLYGADLRYVHTWGRWLAWDGRRFAIDTNGEIHRRAKAAVRAAYAESAQLSDSDARKALAKWATKSEAAARIDAMIQLARAEVPVAHEALDADPWTLNVANGTLDLRTGELRPHRRADLLSKLAPVVYDPSAKAPAWEAFLERILPESPVREFVCRAAGYSLTGHTGEQVLFLLWGGGANGKSTFLETLMAAAGDYALKTPAETLLARRENAIPNDVAALRGARLVAAVESEEGRRLAEVRVKELTGGDTVSARFMRAEWFTFRPVAKLWLATNHRPRVKGTDEAIWRRIRLVPFTVTVPEAERDRSLPDRLRAELPGVLAWAVAGCLEWQRDGLQPPETVTDATTDYRAEQDVLGAFLEDRCVLKPDCWVASAKLFAAYKRWCEDTGEQAMTQRALGLALGERGFTDSRKGGKRDRKRGWHGIGLLEDRPEACGVDA